MDNMIGKIRFCIKVFVCFLNVLVSLDFWGGYMKLIVGVSFFWGSGLLKVYYVSGL